jgi:multiple sugar transport system substrate-binding protein
MVSRKRLSALILVLALIVPLLAACGGGTTSTATTVPGGTVPEATAATGGAATTLPEATAATGGAATAETAATAMPEATAATGGAATAMPEATSTVSGTTGTGGGTEATGATAGASGDVTKIKVEDGATLRFAVAGNATEQKLYQDGVDRFTKVFPNVKVTLEPIPTDYDTAIKAGFSGNTVQDVFLLDGELMGALGPNSLLLPLDDALSASGAQTADYYDPLVQIYQLNGKTYGIPKDFNSLVVFINSDIAQKAGIDPASIKTWDDLKAAAQKMTTGEGPSKTFGMCLNPDIQRYGASILQNGNAIIQDNKAVFNDAQGVAAIDFWYGFKKDGTGELYKEMGKGWCGEAFSGKNAAMVVEGGWIIPFLADPANGATDLKYTAIPLPIPQGGKPATWLFTNAFAANAKTQYPNAAAALVLFLTSTMNEKALVPSGLAQPSLKSLATDPYFTDNPVQKVLVEQGATGQLADSVLGGPIHKGDVIDALNKDAMEPIFLGAKTTQDALNEAAQKVDEALQK